MLQLNTTIDKVNIYRNGAEVYRKGTAELPEGTNTLYVYGLSESIRLDTVRLFSTEGITCSNQRFERISEKNSELESEKIRAKIALLNKQIEVKEYQGNLWKSNGDFTNRTSQSPAEIEEYINKLPERLEKLNLEILDLGKEIAELQKDLENAEEVEKRPLLAVDIIAKHSGTYPFEVRYYETNASWSPVFELHTDSKSSAELRMRARINQYSSEDWKDISVSLFSGNPSSTGQLPDLNPVFLNFQETVAKARNASFFSGAKMEAPMASGMQLEETAMMDMDDTITFGRVEAEEAEISSEETMTEYALPGKRDIPTGSEGTMADLQKYTLNTDYNIVTVPCLDPSAYLIATIKTEDVPFTSSINAAIYLNDIYNGQVYINPDLTKEKIDITLGKEEHVHVSRRELSRKASTTLFKGQKVVDYAYETKITNYSASDVEITVKDQIPISQNKEITVDVKDLSGASLESGTGFLTQKISVSSGKTETLNLSYKVSWPKDKNIKETRTAGKKWCPVCGAEVFGRFCPECGSVVN